MFLIGDNVVDAIGWSEDRREELERRDEQRRAGAGAGGMMAAGFRGSCCEERSESLLQVGRQIVLLLKIAVAVGVLVCVLCVTC